MSKRSSENFKEAFDLFDRDNDGIITTKELGTLMRTLGHNPTDQELDDMVNEVDTSGQGKINYTDFLRMMKPSEAWNEEAELRCAFEVFDKDGDGYISAASLRHVMSKLGEKLSDDDVKFLMKHADVNGDGRVDFKEFVRIVTMK